MNHFKLCGVKIVENKCKNWQENKDLDYRSVSHLAVLRNIFSTNTVRSSEDVEILKKNWYKCEVNVLPAL